MKKKLLITLGCSFTEGIGCYDFSINLDKIHWELLPEKERQLTLDRFHKYSWPSLVGKKLGFDKVINLGYRGSSNSAHIKLFCETLLPKIKILKKEYEILLIWMMTEPSRFSFYSNDRIHSFSPSFNLFGLEKGYNRDTSKLEFSPIIEMKHNLILGEHFFNSLNIPLVVTSWNEEFEKLYGIYKSLSYLSPTPTVIRAFPKNITDEEKQVYSSSICGHPNEKGYEIMANSIVNNIKKYHSNFYFNYENENIELEWLTY